MKNLRKNCLKVFPFTNPFHAFEGPVTKEQSWRRAGEKVYLCECNKPNKFNGN